MGRKRNTPKPPKVEAPKAEAPKVEAPKAEAKQKLEIPTRLQKFQKEKN